MGDLRSKVNMRRLLRDNAVTIMFIVLCAICFYYSGQTAPYVMYELFGRLSRNAFIVLALILPIVAGMGINFAITIGAWRPRFLHCGSLSGAFPGCPALPWPP